VGELYILKCVTTVLRICSQQFRGKGNSEKQEKIEQLQHLTTFHVIYCKVNKTVQAKCSHISEKAQYIHMFIAGLLGVDGRII
jgi:hypothetical protein